MHEVILVDALDQPIGTMEKMEAHRKGLLHRAFSVFVFNHKKELLLQQRALEKYHSGGLWTNTCCSHPAPGETPEMAGERRLHEEMGFSTPLKKRFAFEYRVALDNELTEHELDHVLTGTFDGDIIPNPEEVMAYRWVTADQLKQELREHPEHFTAWLKIIVETHWDSLEI